MHKILIVSETQSYLLMSLKQKLEETGATVFTSKANPDDLSELKDSMDMIFIFVDDALMEMHKGLTYIKDKAVDEDVAIFATGDAAEIKIISKYIPAHMIQKEFPRPINVGDVAAEIESYLKHYGKQNKKKILVVDDSGAMLRNVKGWLEEKYQVILANSGAMAIKYLSTNRPDLVLLDYEMPIVDGKQVLEMMRSESDFSDIPVIFLTGKGDKESVMQVMSLKPDGYLLKTMPPEEIKKAVDDFFERRKAEKY